MVFLGVARLSDGPASVRASQKELRNYALDDRTEAQRRQHVLDRKEKFKKRLGSGPYQGGII